MKKHLSEATRRKISLSEKGKIVSKETRMKLSISHKGQVSWNKGKHLSAEHRRKLSLAKRNMSSEQKRKWKQKLSLFYKGKTYEEIFGSNRKAEEVKKKISLANKGKKRSEEVKRKLSLAFKGRKGHPSWSKGLTKETDARLKILGEHTSAGLKKYFKNPEALKKHSERTKKYYKERPEIKEAYKKTMSKYWEDPLWGKSMSKIKKEFYSENPKWKIEQSKRIRRFARRHPELGKEHSRKMLELMKSSDYRNRLSEIRKEFFKRNPEERKRIGERSKKYYSEHPEAVKKWMQIMSKSLHISPNKPEQKLIKLFKINKIPLKFVGDYSVTVGRSNPDFINFKKKKIVEHFGIYWHGKRRLGINRKKHEVAKVKEYARQGYQCLIIWEDELKNTKKVLERVKTFMRS